MASYSIFSILNTGVLGTYTSKMAMSVTGHNVANANTEGYSRQRPDIVATPPSATGAFGGSTLNVGTGATVNRVERIRDTFLDRQYREISKNYAYWDEKTRSLHYMEQILNEPSEDGMRSYFDGLWNSFLEVMNQPTNSAAVSSVTATANSFITTAQDLYARYEDLRANLNQNIRDSADNINLKLQQIADLNGSIRTTYILKTEPNDLLDKRDVILDELASMTGMTYKTGLNGHLEIFIGNQSVLYGDIWTPIKATVRPGTLNMYDYFVRYQRIEVTGGTVGALFYMRDVSIPNYLDQMDEMALMLSDKVNLIHRTGYDGLGTVTGIDFFKEMEAVRSELPNLFRTMGTHSILNGPIHMISALTPTGPIMTTLALDGKISLVDLNNKHQLHAQDSRHFSTNSRFQDVIDYLNEANLYTTRAYNLPQEYDFGLKPEDFPNYKGKAEIYYKTPERTFTAVNGVLHIGEIEDINNDGMIDFSDIEIKDKNGNRLTNFTYNFVDKIITIHEPFAYTGTVTIRQWESYIGQYRDGELVVPPNEALYKTLSSTAVGTLRLTLDDFVGYTDEAKVFYATQESASFTATNGAFTLPDLVDMDRNDVYDRNDLRIQVNTGSGWVDVANFSYDEPTGRVSILDEAHRSYSGALRVQYWQSERIQLTAAGTFNNAAITGSPVHFGDFDGDIGELTVNDFHVFLRSEASWEAHVFDGVDKMTLTDYPNFTGFARVFYAISASATATAGAFTLSAASTVPQIDTLIDVNRDGKFDASDIKIQVFSNGNWVDVQRFQYDSSTNTITILDTDLEDFDGDVRFKCWESATVSASSTGVLTLSAITTATCYSAPFSAASTATSEDFKVIAPRERVSDDYQVYLETMRADTMRTTTHDYKLLFGKMSDGLDEYGRVDSAKVNSYGDMREMLVFDQDGLLSRLGYQTVSKEFLKISETLLAQPALTWGFTLDESVDPGEFSLRINKTGEVYQSSAVITWQGLAEDFKTNEVLKKYFSVTTITDDDGNVRHTIELNKRLSGPEALSILKGADVLNFQIRNVNPAEIPSENIVWYYDVLDIDEPDATSYSVTFTFPALASPSSPTPVQPIEIEFDDRADLLDQIRKDPILSQYLKIEEKNGQYRLMPTQSINQLQNLEGLEGIETSLKKILSGGAQVLMPSTHLLTTNLEVHYEPKYLTLTVPVFDPISGKTTNTPYTLEFRNRDELVEKINNNAVLNEYVKVFELDGSYYLTHTPNMENLQTLVTRDEYNILSSKTLKVIDTDAYKTLANILYDYSYAMKKDYTFSSYLSAPPAPPQVTLRLNQNLLEYEGKVEVQYAVRSAGQGGAGFIHNPVGSLRKIDYGLLDIRDINGDGVISKDDIRVLGHTTGNDLEFIFNPRTKEIFLRSNPGENVDIVFWKTDTFNLNDWRRNNTTGHTFSLSEPAVHFEDGVAANVDEAKDFLLRVQLPPDEMNLTLGTSPVTASLYKMTMEGLVDRMNDKAPTGLLSDLTPDGKLVFRAGSGANFSFGRRLDDGRIVQLYDISAPTLFLEKMGFINRNSVFGGSWDFGLDIVRNYLDPNAFMHQENTADNLDVDTRQADGLYAFTKRLSLSSQLGANPQLLAVDYGVWYDRNGDWIADMHSPRGGGNSSSKSIMNLMSEARHSALITDGRTSFNDFYGVFIGEMGIEAETSSQMHINTQTMKGQITNAREGVKGVSLDEEMSNLIKYQHAFTAAARIITAVDEMIQTVVSRLGLVGR